jgi:Ca2+/H+ antiporter
MFAIMERSWHTYAIFAILLSGFSLWGWYDLGEWNGFLSAVLITGVFAFLVAALAHFIDSRGNKEEKE